MIYIETGSTDVYYNFGVETYFASERVLDEPVFLFWRTTPTLMIGKYQNPLEEINVDYAREHGIHLVRRLSGGGTIYTDLGGWQFSFISPGDAGEIHFHKYLQPVLGALRALGLDAEFNGRNDLLIGGRKFSGNAQYKLGGVTVHHGSLLFDTDIRQMVESTNVDPYKILSKSIKSVRERVTNLSEHLKSPMSAEDFKARMVAAILDGGARYAIAPEDDAHIRAIADERFRAWQQIYGASPRFSIRREGRFPGGRVAASLDVKRGRIQAIEFSGDFFAANVEALQQALIGCDYRRASVRAALADPALSGAIYGTDPDALAEMIAPDEA